jgi:transposase
MAMAKIKQKRAKKQALRALKKDWVFVGLDVHKKSFHVAIRINGRFQKTLVVPADPVGVCDLLEPLRPGLRQVVYEAGPTGFGLVRELCKRGFPARVIDSCKMPRPAGQSNKSDKVDCKILAKLSEKRMLPFVTVPSESEEGARQVLRTREMIINKIRRVKCQIKSFLLAYSLAEPEGLANWSQKSMEALAHLGVSDDLQFSMNMLLAQLILFTEQRKTVTRRIQQMGLESDRRETFVRLCTHPGVGPLTAMSFMTEIFRPERFASKKQLACYLGLAPRVRQSGETRIEGPTIRAGQGVLRSKLVEAAWSWVRYDAAAKKLYHHLCSNTGNGKKAIIAMARKLATNLWAMSISQEEYRQAA